MKNNFNSRNGIALACVASAFLLSGCFSFINSYQVRTEVHKDGSLDRIIVARDSLSPISFGTTQRNGWSMQKEKRNDTTLSYTFRKHFNSSEEASVLTPSQDSAVYRIQSRLESTYRWFYTTTRFTETYLTIIRFDEVKFDDYFTSDDLPMINSEFIGDTIRKSDSLQRNALRTTLDKYLMRGLMETLVRNTMRLMKINGVDSRWADTLRANKERLWKVGEGAENGEPELISFLTDTLHLPISGFVKKLTDILPTESFLLVPYFEEIGHTIQMPTTVTSTNGGKIEGNTCSWDLTPTYGLKDFDLYAESRTFNYPEIVGTLLALVALLYYANRRRWLTGDDAVI